MIKDRAPARSIVIGTAGHIDHGKTALVKALTGIDTTHLIEEKRRGITIDLGFASRDVQTPDGPLMLSFVDVPGHSAFIRNMLAGAGGIDLVLLVISAQEGIKPQTKEHFAICRLLGAQHGLAVLTKADAVDAARLAAVRYEADLFLKDSFITAEPLAVSAQTGAGISEVLDHLVALSSHIAPRDAGGLVRFPVDRSFSLRGFGTIVTGTLISGTIEAEQRLTIEPGGIAARVRTIQTHGRNYDKGLAGSRVALNLTGVEPNLIPRGSTVVLPRTLTAVDVVDAEISLLPGSPKLRHRSVVSFHAYTSDCAAIVLLYEAPAVEPGGTGFARLKLQKPIVLTPGDRFILRSPSPSDTIGGGVILDAYPLRRQSKQNTLPWLMSLKAASAPEQLLVLRTERRKVEGLGRATAVRETGWPLARIDRLADECVKRSKLARIGSDRLISRAIYDSALDKIKVAIAEFHRSSPSLAGIKKADLQAKTALPAGLFDGALAELFSRSAIKIQGDLVSDAAFQPQLSSKDDQALAQIAAFCATAGLETPRLPDIAAAHRLPEREVQRLLAILVEHRSLVRIAVDMYVHSEHLAALRAKLAELRGRSLDVTQFKQMTNLSRKHAIPWLEYLDRTHITRRSGDTRHVL